MRIWLSDLEFDFLAFSAGFSGADDSTCSIAVENRAARLVASVRGVHVRAA